MKPFYNTINLKEPELSEVASRCSLQEFNIFCLMEIDVSYSPFEVQKEYNLVFPEVPITSIRRAMTNLTKKGMLIKTGMKKERYGHMNHLWRKVVSL